MKTEKSTVEHLPEAEMVERENENAGKEETKQPVKTTKQLIAALEAAGFRELLEQINNDGRQSGFRDGVRYIVTLAESKAEKTPADMPVWWTATLVEALHHEPVWGGGHEA